jgi:hypothetical protein
MNHTTTAEKTKAPACGCPMCRGLQLFDSPRYASGAVLTADDLSSEQAYVRAKMRLHNRHLHGWGTVCGLEVVCDDCEGSVLVMPGYAIDPCGNDLVLVDDTRFDVIKAIRECCDARRPKLGACDPYVPPADPGCKDTETHWCISLRFEERETAQTFSLGRQPGGGCSCGGKSGSCGCGGRNVGGGCGCGGRGGNCTCGGKGHGGTQILATQTSSVSAYGLPGCTPRRLVECVEIGLIEHKGPCAPNPHYDRVTWTQAGEQDFPIVPPDSLLGRILSCFTDAFDLLSKRLTTQDSDALSYLDTGVSKPGVTARTQHDALCRLRQALLDFMMRHNPVRCQMLRTLGELLVPALGMEESASAYRARASAVYENIASIWLQAVMDCVCGAILPSCPDDPMDSRVPIACVTVRGDRIINICNHSCRPYAGAFPSLFHWFSIVPIIPLLKRLIAAICCAPDAVSKNSPLVNNLMPIIASLDPTGSWRRAFTEDGYALPGSYLKTARELDIPTVLRDLFKPAGEPVSTAAVVGQPIAAAQEKLAARGLHVRLQDVDDPNATHIKLSTAASGIVASGQPVTLYVHGGKVVGVARAKSAETVLRTHEEAEPAADEEMTALRSELTELRERIARLEKGRRR